MDYITANFSPFERYAIKVCTGHTGPYARFGVDIGYLDWRYIQNINACANGIVKGKWLEKGSGLAFSEQAARPAAGAPAGGSSAGRPPAGGPPAGGPPAGGAQKMVSFTYGIAALNTSLEAAYDAAGLEMPK